MGQKVNPIGFRLGISRTWDARWFAGREYADLLHEDIRVRKYILDQLPFAAIPKVEIERATDRVRITIHTARPGIVIGRKGADVERLRGEIQDFTGKEVLINIHEIRTPEVNAQLIAQNVAEQLLKRVSFRRAMKRAVSTAMGLGATGIKIACGGRLGGAEMSRREWYREGRVPLQTLAAGIDYGFAESKTTHGQIGVKVWVYADESKVLPGRPQRERRGPGGRTR